MEIQTLEIFGFAPAFKGLRNPMNSWDKSDSGTSYENIMNKDYNCEQFKIGEKDLKLAKQLILAGSEHCKFLRQIQVWANLDMTRYWWSEFDTYHYNSKNSCSTMHKLLNKQNPIVLDMFEHCEEDIDIANIVIQRLNEIREIHNVSTDQKIKDHCLLRAKRLLMEGFLQLRTVNTNYAELRNMYFQRRRHRLKEEWVDTFCKWVEELPYAAELITVE